MVERLQGLQNVCALGRLALLGQRSSPRRTGARTRLRGRNGVPIVRVMYVPLIMLIVPNAIASQMADGKGLLKCLAHRACFLCCRDNVVSRRHAVTSPALERTFPPSARRVLQTRAFSHTQDQQAAIFGELTRLAGSIMLCVLTVDVHVPRLGRSQCSVADCRRMMRSLYCAQAAPTMWAIPEGM